MRLASAGGGRSKYVAEIAVAAAPIGVPAAFTGVTDTV